MTFVGCSTINVPRHHRVLVLWLNHIVCLMFPCAGHTDKLKGMKESDSERVANCTGPEPCVGRPQGRGRSVGRGTCGLGIEPRNRGPVARATGTLQGADGVETGGRQHWTCRYREARPDPARSETPRTHGINLYGNREIPASSEVEGTADRIVKPQGERR